MLYLGLTRELKDDIVYLQFPSIAMMVVKDGSFPNEPRDLLLLVINERYPRMHSRPDLLPSSLLLHRPSLRQKSAQMPALVEKRKRTRIANVLYDRWTVSSTSWPPPPPRRFRSSSYTQVKQRVSAYPACVKQIGMSDPISSMNMSRCPFIFETLIRFPL